VSERATFISAILDHWDDDTPRLVFADWLQEHGEAERAEFIRVQIEAAKLPKSKREKSKPGKRAARLLDKHEAAWRAAAGLTGDEGEYERGFLVNADFWIRDLEARAAAVLAVEPAQFTLMLSVWLNDESDEEIPPKWVTKFAANPHLRAVTAIESDANDFGPELFVRLMKSPHLVNLRRIEVSEDPFGEKGVRAIAVAPAAFALERLHLDEVFYHEDDAKARVRAMKALATSPRLASLKHLGLPYNGLTDKCIEVLLASKTLPKTMRLNLDENDYDEERFADQLAARFVFGSDEGDDEGD
jgi:uncharacterized protein (TIGR02996 family)